MTSRSGISQSRADWYVACQSRDLNPGPIRSVIRGTPLVLFRPEGGLPGALLDRCPHRNAPLSRGTVSKHQIQCEYHGWRFNSDGQCIFAAGIPDDKITRACHATSFPVREQQGFIWVSSLAGTTPKQDPFRFSLIGDAAYSTDVAVLNAEGSVHAVAENALDVPHTMYLHGGLFRQTGGRRIEREVEVRNYGDRVEAEYFGEERPSGLAGFLLAPGGGAVRHVDQFLLPSITVVDYQLGERTHVNVTVALTPVLEFQTRLYAVVSFRLPLPAVIMKPLLRPLLLKIFRQDAEILARQTANLKLFGEERFATTDADTLGPEIARLLKSAETESEIPVLETPIVRKARIVL